MRARSIASCAAPGPAPRRPGGRATLATAARSIGGIAMAALLLLLSSAGVAHAQWTEIVPGVDHLARTDPGPNHVKALRVDLCSVGIRIRATASEERGQRTSAWGSAVGAVAAINGGYFVSGYRPDGGRAAGDGAEWPDSTDTNYRGALSFGRGHVAHSEAGAVAPLPEWAEEAVNGDATLVRGGAAVDCGGCGGGRAPRTAVGITADRRTLYLVTVDGRGASVGMTIDELAALMAGFGVDRAMNLDGGGSTTMWIRGRGVVNSPSDGSERTVANHLAVLARGPGHPQYNCPAGYSAFYAGSEFEGDTSIPIEAGTTASGALSFVNTGTEEWSGRTRLAPTPRDAESPVAAPSWIGPTRITAPDSNVAPGETGRFRFELYAPPTPGMYQMTFSMVEEGVTWFADSWGPADDAFFIHVISTPPPDYRAEVVRIDGLPEEGPVVIERGQRVTGAIALRNTGSVTWEEGVVRIATTEPRDRESAFAADSWPNASRASSNDVPVAVGESHVFAVELQAPDAVGEHVESFGVVAEGQAWFADRGGPADDVLRFELSVVEERPDAGRPDGGSSLAGKDGGGRGAGSASTGGCGCRVAGAQGGRLAGPESALVGVLVVLWRFGAPKRRRSAR